MSAQSMLLNKWFIKTEWQCLIPCITNVSWHKKLTKGMKAQRGRWIHIEVMSEPTRQEEIINTTRKN